MIQNDSPSIRAYSINHCSYKASFKKAFFVYGFGAIKNKK